MITLNLLLCILGSKLGGPDTIAWRCRPDDTVVIEGEKSSNATAANLDRMTKTTSTTRTTEKCLLTLATSILIYELLHALLILKVTCFSLRRLFSSNKFIHNLGLVEPIGEMKSSIDLEQFTRRVGRCW